MNKGTELPFSGVDRACKDEGIFECVCRGSFLFSSDRELDLGTS